VRQIKFLIVFFALISSCSSADTREETILKYFADIATVSKFEVYLVNPAQYTTKGNEYHQKYHQYLLGVARSVIEEKNLTITESSIGFYYDKREAKKNKLYLGIDIQVPLYVEGNTTGYQAAALSEIKKYLKDVIYVMQSCTTIFKEQDVVGSVIGLHWEREGQRESVTIWIDKDDVISFEKKTLTFDELVQRSFITNTEAKIIRLLR
jgi:hypothetical protein